MADKVDFDIKLKYVLKECLNDKITLKEEQCQALEQLFVKKKDLVAVLRTGFGKSPIFQLLVLLARCDQNLDKNRPLVIVITPLVSIIKDQILEIESFGLTGCNLVDALDNYE